MIMKKIAIGVKERKNYLWSEVRNPNFEDRWNLKEWTNAVETWKNGEGWEWKCYKVVQMSQIIYYDLGQICDKNDKIFFLGINSYILNNIDIINLRPPKRM